MGDYTSTQHFYKPDPDDLVDVESQVEYNLERADQRIKPLVEWQHTEEPFITDGHPEREVAYKYYKEATNSLWAVHSDGIVYHSSGASEVNSWSTSGITFSGDYTYDGAAERVSYRKDPDTGIVSWRGSAMRTSYGVLTRNTNTVFMVAPADVRPVRAKYFIVHLGIVSGSYWIARVLFHVAGNVEYNLMGSSSTGSADQRVISLNDISYPTDDGP